MAVFIEKRYLQFENLELIPLHFVSAQWSDLVTHKVFIDRLTIYCMDTEVLALQDEYSSFFLSNLLQNHVTLAELAMVGPGKLMVGHRP